MRHTRMHESCSGNTHICMSAPTTRCGWGRWRGGSPCTARTTSVSRVNDMVPTTSQDNVTQTNQSQLLHRCNCILLLDFHIPISVYTYVIHLIFDFMFFFMSTCTLGTISHVVYFMFLVDIYMYDFYMFPCSFLCCSDFIWYCKHEAGILVQYGQCKTKPVDRHRSCAARMGLTQHVTRVI